MIQKDFREFLLSFSLSARGNLDGRLNWAFDFYDQNTNDYIEKKELVKAIEVFN